MERKCKAWAFFRMKATLDLAGLWTIGAERREEKHDVSECLTNTSPRCEPVLRNRATRWEPPGERFNNRVWASWLREPSVIGLVWAEAVLKNF